MIKLTDEELDVMSNQVSECYPCDMLREIRDWQKTIKSETLVLALDTVADIINENTIWE